MEQENPAGGRVVGYDLIRVLSCFFVIVVHFNAAVCGYAGGIFLYPNEIIPNFYLGGKVYLGTLGVNLFFILSGASLMRANQGTVHAGPFYRKRLLSLYPAFWIAFFVATCVDFLIAKGIPAAHPVQMLTALTGLDGYLSQLGLASAVYYKLGEWFYGAIVLLYLLFPLAHRCVKRIPAAVAVACAGMYVVGLWAISRGIPHCYNTSLLICLPEMVLGMLYVRYDLHNRPRLSMGISLVALMAAVVFSGHLMRDFLTLLLAVSIFLALMVFSRLLTGTRVAHVLEKTAKLTYPMFLVHHWLIYKLVEGFDRSTMPRLYVAMLFLIYLAAGGVLSCALQSYSGKLADCLRKSRFLFRVAALVIVAGMILALTGVQFKSRDAVVGHVQPEVSEAFNSQIVSVKCRGNEIVLTVENSGSITWTEQEQYRCGLLKDGADCGIRGFLEPGMAVEPGQSVVFTIPLPEGIRTESLQVVMLKEGVTYFGAVGNVAFEEELP